MYVHFSLRGIHEIDLNLISIILYIRLSKFAIILLPCSLYGRTVTTEPRPIAFLSSVMAVCSGKIGRNLQFFKQMTVHVYTQENGKQIMIIKITGWNSQKKVLLKYKKVRVPSELTNIGQVFLTLTAVIYSNCFL